MAESYKIQVRNARRDALDKFNTNDYSNDPSYLLSSSAYELNQNKKQIIILFDSISQILYRKFLFFDIRCSFSKLDISISSKRRKILLLSPLVK